MSLRRPRRKYRVNTGNRSGRIEDADHRSRRTEDLDSPYQTASPDRRRRNRKLRRKPARREHGRRRELPELPDSLRHLMQQNVSTAILDRLKLPVLFFYTELLKNHYERARGNRAMLSLIHDLTLATRARIAAVAIQRKFRASFCKRKTRATIVLQCAQRSAVARHTLKTMKAVRFLRRLQQRGLVRCVQRWQNETKLAKFNRNKVGEKGRVFDAWYLYAARIKAFKKKILKHRIREYCAPCVTAWWLYICKIRKVRIFVYKVLTGQKRRRFRRCARFSVINSRARRLQCWYRCVRARWQLFLLKLHNLCTRLAQGTIGLAGRQATSRIRKNSATAIQSAFRGLLDRRWAVEYRKERRQQFENRIREWHSHMRSAGIRGICKELAKMNKGLVKSDWNFTHSAEFASKLDALQPHQPRLPMADSAVSKKGSVSSSFASIDCMGVKRIPASVSTTRLLFRKLGRHITKEEADMTSRLLHERDRQITLATLVRFLDAGVVYSANDAADGRASLPEVLIRGSHLKVVKLLKHATGKVKKQRRERERIARAQLNAQLDAWMQFERRCIYCFNCQRPFCFGSELVFKHLHLRPRYVANTFLHGSTSEMMTLRGKFDCTVHPGPVRSTRETFLRGLFGNDLVFLAVDELGKTAPWAHHRLKVGGMLD
jgi:hypothetical protein